MSLMAKMINLGVKMSGMKKKYSLPEEQFLAEVRKMNRSRVFYMPKDHKAIYKKHIVLGHECLVVQKEEKRSEKTILYFFGGGMMIGPDKGDLHGVDHIHFVYSTDEVLYGAKQNFIEACKSCGVKYTVRERPGMIHCYAMLPYFRESKEDFEEIAQILAK